jgi:D-glycero-alpha-D-manno-heptose 1-phosphate guanylyltransferase
MSADLDLNEMIAVILAGGLGTRVQHLLPGVPKPMAPVAGRPFLEWVVRYLAKQGLRRVIISTGYLTGVVERHFEAQPVRGVDVQCVAETEPLGTGGGFLHAVRQSKESAPAWLVLNGDSLVFANLALAAAPFSDANVSGVVVGRAVPDASRYGTLAIGKSGELLRFEEKRPGVGVINSGVYLLRHSLLAEFPSQTPLSFERDVFPSLIGRGFRLQTVVTDAPFLDIGTPESLPQAEGFIRDNLREFAVE